MPITIPQILAANGYREEKTKAIGMLLAGAKALDAEDLLHKASDQLVRDELGLEDGTCVCCSCLEYMEEEHSYQREVQREMFNF